MKWKVVPLDDVSKGDQVQFISDEACYQGTFQFVEKGMDGQYRFFISPVGRPTHIADYKMSTITQIAKAFRAESNE